MRNTKKQHSHPFMEVGRNIEGLPALEELGDLYHMPPLMHANHEHPSSSRANIRNLFPEGVTVSPGVFRPESQLPPPMYRRGSTAYNNGVGIIGSGRFGHERVGTSARNHTGGETLVAIRDNTDQDGEFLEHFNMCHLKEAMTHPMASRVFQDKIGHCSQLLRRCILVSLRQGCIPLLQVCCDSYGTRSLQKLFQHLSTFRERRFAAMILSTMAASLFKNLHGQRAIEFCLSNFSNEENKCIFMEASRHLLEIATNQLGCFMLTKCIKTSEGYHRTLLLVEIAKNSIQLALDPYGNFLVPKLFEYHMPYTTSYMLWNLQGNYHRLSEDKFGSYVVQKCLENSSRMQFETIAWELMGGPSFTELFVHPYGNYIVQSMLSVAKGWGVLYDELKVIIENKQEQLRCDPYGQKVLRRLHSTCKRKIRTTSVDGR